MSEKQPQTIVESLIQRFEKSGHTEMEALVELCRDHLHNEKFDKEKLDKDSLALLDSILGEVITAARTIREALYREANWYGHPRETIELACGFGTEKLEPKTAFIEVAPRYIGIGFTGHGVCIMQPDSEVVLVEHIEGAPRVHVFADINCEEATHTVELDGSKQTNRKK